MLSGPPRLSSARKPPQPKTTVLQTPSCNRPHAPAPGSSAPCQHFPTSTPLTQFWPLGFAPRPPRQSAPTHTHTQPSPVSSKPRRPAPSPLTRRSVAQLRLSDPRRKQADYRAENERRLVAKAAGVALGSHGPAPARRRSCAITNDLLITILQVQLAAFN